LAETGSGEWRLDGQGRLVVGDDGSGLSAVIFSYCGHCSCYCLRVVCVVECLLCVEVAEDRGSVGNVLSDARQHRKSELLF
jgi:hypothetical protein